MAHRLQVFVVVLLFHAVFGERDGLILNFERAFIDPNGDWRMWQAPLPVELPILETQETMSIQLSGKAGCEQNAVENRLILNCVLI